MPATPFQSLPLLSYLGLPEDYQPSPKDLPVAFLLKHVRQLPPHLLLQFSSITTPRERTAIPEIRNRRLKYMQLNSSILLETFRGNSFFMSSQGNGRPGEREGQQESEWVTQNFLGGSGAKQHVGKLGNLLGGYEEEREAERIRALRREQATQQNCIPEEEESSDEDEEDTANHPVEEETPEEAMEFSERQHRERFIYGLWECSDYDTIDWDEQLDFDADREAEERWFDEEE